ncbi:hypothetical protein G6F24_018836 [Rhizopus arrhizus]|nr:hypothetical protein G6F24_018836 [Rhizopus arrhizus]
MRVYKETARVDLKPGGRPCARSTRVAPGQPRHASGFAVASVREEAFRFGYGAHPGQGHLLYPGAAQAEIRQSGEVRQPLSR